MFLSEKRCKPCTAGTPRLKTHEITPLYTQLNEGWHIIEERHLEKEFPFPDFKSALHFTNDIGEIAESEGHHPDITVAWGRVKVVLWTHKIHGLSEADFILAAKIDRQFGLEGIIKDL